MLDLSLSLMNWAASRLSSHKYEHLQIEVSDATVKVRPTALFILRFDLTHCLNAAGRGRGEDPREDRSALVLVQHGARHPRWVILL